MKYEYSESLQVLAEDIARRLFPHISTSRIKCFRSLGSGSNSFAKCHPLSPLLQQALSVDSFYVLEFMKENFDELPTENKVKVVICELMKIPEKFNSGTLILEKVTKENIRNAYNTYLECRKGDSKIDFFKKIKEEQK